MYKKRILLLLVIAPLSVHAVGFTLNELDQDKRTTFSQMDLSELQRKQKEQQQQEMKRRRTHTFIAYKIKKKVSNAIQTLEKDLNKGIQLISELPTVLQGYLQKYEIDALPQKLNNELNERIKGGFTYAYNKIHDNNNLNLKIQQCLIAPRPLVDRDVLHGFHNLYARLVSATDTEYLYKTMQYAAQQANTDDRYAMKALTELYGYLRQPTRSLPDDVQEHMIQLINELQKTLKDVYPAIERKHAVQDSLKRCICNDSIPECSQPDLLFEEFKKMHDFTKLKESIDEVE